MDARDCHKTLVSRLHLFQTFVGGMAKQVELSIRCVVKATTKVPLKCLLGKHFTHSRREENMGMRSKLPMITASSATFKSSLLVLCGLYPKRLLCKFEKDYSVIECVVDVAFRSWFPSLLTANKLIEYLLNTGTLFTLGF